MDFAELLRLVVLPNTEAQAVLKDWMMERGASEAAVKCFLEGQLWDRRRDFFFDTVLVGPNLDEVTENHLRYAHEFFRDLASKTAAETNLVSPRRLPRDVAAFTLQAVRVEVEGPPPPKASLRVMVNHRQVLEAPLSTFLEAGWAGVPPCTPPIADLTRWSSGQWDLRRDDDLFVTLHHGGSRDTAKVRVFLEGLAQRRV